MAWKGEGQRHSLARKGVKTGQKSVSKRPRTKKDQLREQIDSPRVQTYLDHQRMDIDTAIKDEDYKHFDYQIYSKTINEYSDGKELRVCYHFPNLSFEEVLMVQDKIEENTGRKTFLEPDNGIVLYDEI